VLVAIFGLLYVLLVRPGTPSDEPAHFATAQYYAQHWRMPILGQPDVTYEGQMGPAYYTLAAVVLSVSGRFGTEAGFYVLRLLGLLLLLGQATLVYLLAARLAPGRRVFPITTALFVALNPSLLAIGASVQNDMLAIFLALLATYLSARWIQDRDPAPGSGIVIGALVGLAILSKATTVFLIPVIPLYAWRVRGTRAFPLVAAFLLTVAAVSGWWFLRNFLLYGDITAQHALTKYHYGNNPPPMNLLNPRVLVRCLWNVFAFYWGPSEYYRGAFHIPLWIRAGAAAFNVVSLVGWARAFRAHTYQRANANVRAFAWFLGAQYAVCMAIFIYVCFRITYFAPRTTFPTFVVYAVFLTFGGLWAARQFGDRCERAYALLLAVFLVMANAYCLWQCSTMPVHGFHLFT
jgi:D-alanyl-D-alanine carboxypeptidase (penicillin-binding protein 5/6)